MTIEKNRTASEEKCMKSLENQNQTKIDQLNEIHVKTDFSLKENL